MVHFDFEMLKNYLDGDKVILVNFITLLQKELPASLKEVEASLAARDLKGLREAAHKLKGTSLSAGLTELTKQASRINKLTTLDGVDGSALVSDLKNEIELVTPLLQQALLSLK